MLLPIWVTDSFPVIRIIIMILIAVCAVLLCAAVLIQPQKDDSMGALGGQTTGTYYAQNKSKNIEGFFKRATVALSIIIASLSIIFFITVAIYPVGLMP